MLVCDLLVCPVSNICFVFVPSFFCKRILHPAFEEDEILLIFVGGVLGLIAGGLQVVIFYS